MTVIKTSFRIALFSFVLALAANSSAQAQAPVITASPGTTVIYNYTLGGVVPTAQTVTFSSSGATVNVTSAALSYPGSPVTGWITLLPIPPDIATPAQITPYLNSSVLSTLPAGIYIAQIQLSFDTAVDPSSQSSIAIFLIVSGSGGGVTSNETIAASPTSLSFSFAAGGSAPPAQTLSITTSDNANFTATAGTNDGNAWLTISPTSGATPGTINVSANPLTLAAGTYNGTITIQGSSSSVQVPVTFVVGGGVSLTLSTSSVTFNVPQNYGLSAPQYIQVTAPTATDFQAFASSDFNWLLFDAGTGVTPATVTLTANSSNLAQGTYMGMVTVETSPSSAIQVPVALNVGPPATLQLSPSSVAFSYTVGNSAPATQTVNIKSLTGVAQTFTVTTSTTDGAAWLMASATAPTPGLVSIGINPGTLLPGSYTGVVSVLPSATGSTAQPITVNLTVLPAPTPVVLSVLSSASYVGGAVAPGEFVTLFGSALGPAALTTPTPGTAPDSLGGTTVTFDGIPAPILYSSSTQTSVQVPYGIMLPQTVLQVQRAGSTSATTMITSVPAFPGLFTANAKGNGEVAAFNQDFTLNGPSNPAPRGSTIVLYGTGEGKTYPVSVEGTITVGVAPFPQPLFPVSVTFNGVPAASIAYAGETPTALAGLMQINAVIPMSAPTGPAIGVLVTINGQTSPGNVTVAIQ